MARGDVEDGQAQKQRRKMPRWLKVTLIAIPVAIVAFFGVSFYVMTPRPAEADPNKERVACIGDSITFGHAVAFTRDTQSYPAYLEDDLGDGYQVINYGYSGKTLQDEGDEPYSESGFLDQAIAAKASTYIVMLGTNDSKPFNWDAARYERELEALVDKLAALDWDHEVVLMDPPKAFPEGEGKGPAFSIDDDVIRDEIKPIVERVASEHGLRVVDLYTFTEDHPEWFADGIHPNAEGNKAIADYIYEQVFS